MSAETTVRLLGTLAVIAAVLLTFGSVVGPALHQASARMDAAVQVHS